MFTGATALLMGQAGDLLFQNEALFIRGFDVRYVIITIMG